MSVHNMRLIWVRKSINCRWKRDATQFPVAASSHRCTASISPRTRPHVYKHVWLRIRHLLFRNFLPADGIATIISNNLVWFERKLGNASRVKACGYNIQPFHTIELLYGYNILKIWSFVLLTYTNCNIYELVIT